MHNLKKEGRMVRSGHYVGLKFDDAWWFIKVINSSVEELKPWQFLNDNGNRAEIAADTAGDQDEVRDEQNRLLLEPNDDERGLVYQILTGVAPSRIQLFPFFGREQNLGLETSIEPGGDEVWINGFDSPYNDASEQSEVFYINDMSRLRFQAFNPNDEPLPAKASFHINKLHYATVTDINLMKAMLQNQVPCKKHSMGLGATPRDQLDVPNWLNTAFGQHLYSTSEITQNGDASQASGSIDLRDNVNLQNPGGS